MVWEGHMMDLSAGAGRREIDADVVVHRIVVAGFEAVIRRRADRGPNDHDAYAVVIGPVSPAGGPVEFARDDLQVVEQLARRAYLAICHAQGETILVEKR